MKNNYKGRAAGAPKELALMFEPRHTQTGLYFTVGVRPKEGLAGLVPANPFDMTTTKILRSVFLKCNAAHL